MIPEDLIYDGRHVVEYSAEVADFPCGECGKPFHHESMRVERLNKGEITTRYRRACCHGGPIWPDYVPARFSMPIAILYRATEQCCRQYLMRSLEEAASFAKRHPYRNESFTVVHIVGERDVGHDFVSASELVECIAFRQGQLVLPLEP